MAVQTSLELTWKMAPIVNSPKPDSLAATNPDTSSPVFVPTSGHVGKSYAGRSQLIKVAQADDHPNDTKGPLTQGKVLRNFLDEVLMEGSQHLSLGWVFLNQKEPPMESTQFVGACRFSVGSLWGSFKGTNRRILRLGLYLPIRSDPGKAEAQSMKPKPFEPLKDFTRPEVLMTAPRSHRSMVHSSSLLRGAFSSC